MFKFISWPQILAWHVNSKIAGPVTVLKQVEHYCFLPITIQLDGHRSLGTLLEIR